jgi:hypothetical protein
MLQEKIIQLNCIAPLLQKNEDLISFYETQAKAADDPICASFLKNIADKKSIQLIFLEKMLRNRGMEIVPISGSEQRKGDYSTLKLFEKNLEDIFNFISKQSLNDLKSLWFFSMENREAELFFKAMFELEEDFLVFVECDYLHHLAESTARADLQQSQQENAMLLASAG